MTAVIVSFLSDEVRQRLRIEHERAKSAAKTAAAAGKSTGKWVPRFRRVQLDADTAGLKDLATEPAVAAKPPPAD